MLNSDMTYGKHCQEQKVNFLTTVKKVEPVIGIGGRFFEDFVLSMDLI